MKYAIIYAPTALETFNEISRQVNDRWGDKYVDEFKHRSIKVIETIAQSPFIFQAIQSNSKVRKGVIHRNCSVFYEVKEYTVTILFFWDNRQEPIF